MRLLFTSLASHGHLYPLLPLAVAAHDAGHEVVVATGANLLPEVEQAGLTGAAAGIAMREAFFARRGPNAGPPGDLDPAEMLELATTVLGSDLPRRFLADLGPVIAREAPDLVIAEAGNLGGVLAAIRAGIPVVRHGFGRLNRDELTDGIAGRATELADELGMADPFDGPLIDICPDSAQHPETVARPNRVRLRPVGWNPPGDLPAWITDRAAGRPLVYLTLGTAMGNPPVFRAAIAGLGQLDADVLVSTGPTVPVAELGAVPPNVRVHDWVPQRDLLPHLDLVVHHGGSGTTMGAFAVGLPQLLLPQGADQFSNGELVRSLHLGDRLLPAEVTAAAVTEAAGRLLTDPEARTAARRLADEVAAMPTPDEVVAQLTAG
jgi:UDP:flavonoid glycosyltransferase YjiC (YdhE family)